jgi:hypothetical protein
LELRDAEQRKFANSLIAFDGKAPIGNGFMQKIEDNPYYAVNGDVQNKFNEHQINVTDEEGEKIRKENEEARNEQANKDKARAEEIARRKGTNADDEDRGILKSTADFFKSAWSSITDLATAAYNWVTGTSVDNRSMVKRAFTKDLFDKDTVKKNLINAAGSGLDALIDETGKSVNDAKSKGVSVYDNLSKEEKDKYSSNIRDSALKEAGMGYGANALSNLMNSKNTIDLILGVGAGLGYGGYLINQERNNKDWNIKLGPVQFGHNKEDGKYGKFSFEFNF